MKPALTSVSRESPRQQDSSTAFSRLDALIVCATIALLLAICIPALAHTAARSERLQCLNNLRLIGNAFNAWSADHGNHRPCRVLLSQGGTFPEPIAAKVGAAWFEFSWVSNYMVSPQILVCPSDTETRRIAKDFGNQADRGLLHFNYRDNAISYFLHLDAGTRSLTGATMRQPEFSNYQFLAGDRNVQVDSDATSCSSGVVNAASVDASSGPAASQVGWTNGIHQFSGNLLMNDGRVLETSTEDFLASFAGDGNGPTHILMPR